MCMCGDTHCWSCGPAQGNFRCPLCGVWADDGCEHIDENGEVKQEFSTDLEAILTEQKEEEERFAQWLEEDKRIEAEYKEWKKLNVGK